MTDTTRSSTAVPWRKTRFGFVALLALSLLSGWTLLRAFLFSRFAGNETSFSELAQLIAAGFQRDLFMALVFSLPWLGWFVILRDRAFGEAWHRWLFTAASFGFIAWQIFQLAIEYYFFEEFRSRFNTVAVDYLIYPHEVFVNIGESYPVIPIVSACLILGVAWTWLARRLCRPMWNDPAPLGKRFFHFVGALALALVLAVTFNFKGATISKDRTLNEIANNGPISFIAAFWTRNLDYTAFYKTLPKEEAYARARRLLTEPGVEFVNPGESIRRRIAGDATKPRLNLVIILEESLGSEFWGCLGRTNTLTPAMDRLALEEGWLFTNLYASGNRTVRGFEGVLASFPPLPGDSIVKRDRSENVETIARVLKRDGYNTLFLYGGRGVFDGMRAFAVHNGYDKFVEQKHFENPSFTTAWGVADEDLFKRTVTELRDLSKQDKPFCATVLTVSNHKPYTYPTGRIAEDPLKKKREHAVKYSDWCLGEFFKAVKNEPYWTNTVFCVVADHGARVYGSQTIPIKSYEIPMVLLGPALVKEPKQLDQLGCSLDVPVTLLGLIGRPYESLFFGRDLLKGDPAHERVLINHNRSIGIWAKERMIVLSLQKSVEYYEGDPKKVEVRTLANPGATEQQLSDDCAALFQVADDLYMNQRYHLDP
jgi:phosphoglycerol transferase MdoB-like AlkP superfamily enzyme